MAEHSVRYRDVRTYLGLPLDTALCVDSASRADAALSGILEPVNPDRLRGSVCGLTGSPIAHSLSPRLHAYFSETLGLDYAYRLYEAEDACVFRTIANAMGEGCDPRIAPTLGLNVTTPYKQPASEICRSVDAVASAAGAANCICFDVEKGMLRGFNTDGPGVVEACRALFGGADDALDGCRVLICGTGSLARALAVSFSVEGAQAHLLSRSEERAKRVRDDLAHPESIGACSYETACLHAGYGFADADIIINATVLGMDVDDPAPFDLALCGNAKLAVECVYASGETAFLRQARELGLPVIDGGDVLIFQGAYSLVRWTRR